LALIPARAVAQENYEIQVYGSETMQAGHTIVELHSNFTGTGSTATLGSMLPTNHALHETIEITHGFNEWFEVGWYIFTAVPTNGGWNWVGDHIRPRVRAPESWHLPVGLSLSTEVGYQRKEFSEDTWSVEIRPIIDKQMGRFYWSLNPTMGVSLDNPAGDHSLTFEPNVAVGFDVTEQVNLSVEYYGAMGPITGLLPSAQQEHLIFPAVNLNVSPKWEINFGVGFGLTDTGDKGIVKLITGYRL
jgi:hypothetical protein